MTNPILNGDTSQIVTVADKAVAIQGEYEGYLRAWVNVKDDLAKFVQSNGLGSQIQNTMGEAHRQGIDIVRKMEEILTALRESGARFTDANEQAARRVGAVSLGSNFGSGEKSIDTGSW